MREQSVSFLMTHELASLITFQLLLILNFSSNNIFHSQLFADQKMKESSQSIPDSLSLTHLSLRSMEKVKLR